jgi:hypothetical protein
MGTTGRCKRHVRVVMGSHKGLGGVFSQGRTFRPDAKSLPSADVAKCNFLSAILIEVSLGRVFSMLPHSIGGII